MQQVQVVNSSFSAVVKEVEQLIKEGYSVVHEGEAAPYHMILGSFIVTLQRNEADRVVGEATAEPAQPANRGGKRKQ